MSVCSVMSELFMGFISGRIYDCAVWYL